MNKVDEPNQSARSGIGTPAGAASGLRDRRAAVRFSIEREVRYRIVNGSTIEVGAGQTINLSSRGVLFSAQRRLAVGERLEMAVAWPAHLDDGCQLKLVIRGRVIRNDGTRAAIAIEHYEFRTRGLAQPL